MHLSKLMSLAALLKLSIALPRDLEDRSVSCYKVAGVGTFTNYAKYTFPGTTLPSALHASTNENYSDVTPSKTYYHEYLASNSYVSGGYLNIKVPGGQKVATGPSNPVKAGQVTTQISNILYASVRTQAIMSDEPGTCQSTFFYKSDTQEIDVEYLSSPKSVANTNGKPAIHFTNHGSTPDITWSTPSSGGGVSKEYRIDWTAGQSSMYVDGKLYKQLTTNVPSTPGTWSWNNWANGDPEWTAGPPVNDNIMKISSITMYYNTSDSASVTCS